MRMIMEPSSPQASAPKPAQPVMDIKAPPARVANNEPVKVAPPEAGTPEPLDSKTEAKKAKPPKVPKQRSSGVGLAITATVIIILGLGALFVYAYFQK